MNVYQKLIKRGEEFFQHYVKEPDSETSGLYLKWYTVFKGISVTSAWRKVWFAYYKRQISAVAAVVLLLLSISLFIPFGTEEERSETTAELILPATDNIILKTSKGMSLMIDSLENVDTLLQGVSLDKDGIVYSASSSEIADNSSSGSIEVDKGMSGDSRTDSKEIEYNELFVPKGRVFSIRLSDGTRVWLNSESYIKYPVNFAEERREVILSGEAYFDVKKDKERDFVVRTSGYSVNVLGTKFNVRAYENDEVISTTLVEGSVALNTDETSEFRISPGEQFAFERGTGTISVSKVDVHLYTSWINNQLIIRSNTLWDILKVLQRRYDVDVFFSDEAAKHEQYSGEVPLNDNLNVILDQISKVSDIEFQIEGRLIVVRYK
jgi:hypothetical protein